MPSYIVKLEHEGVEYFMEWSTIVDSPVTFGMSRKAFEKYYEKEYGRRGMFDLPERMKRVEAKGTSSRLHDCAEDLMWVNRAGPKECGLTKLGIIEMYCLRVEDEKRIRRFEVELTDDGPVPIGDLAKAELEGRDEAG